MRAYLGPSEVLATADGLGYGSWSDGFVVEALANAVQPDANSFPEFVDELRPREARRQIRYVNAAEIRQRLAQFTAQIAQVFQREARE